MKLSPRTVRWLLVCLMTVAPVASEAKVAPKKAKKAQKQAPEQKAAEEAAPETKEAAADANAAAADPDAHADGTEPQGVQLSPQSGTITLGDKLAELKLPETLRYLSPQDSKKVLEDIWGNPPMDELTLGMIVPATLALDAVDGWGVVITYEADGHVKDEDAAETDYPQLLTEMKESTAEESKYRVERGFDSMELVGWAEAPSYDAQNKKLYWAKELKTGSSPVNTLNYNIRVLGKEGVLVLNAIAGMPQLEQIKKEMQQVVAITQFLPGNTYAEFNESTDKLAAYGIGGLIAGKVAAKAGLFAVLLKILLAGKKLFIVAAIALGATVKRWFGKKDEATTLPQSVPPSPNDPPPLG